MFKPISSLFLLCFVIACVPNKVEQLEERYAKALASGQVEQQIVVISELSALGSEKYQHHIRLYQQLKPSLVKLAAGKSVAHLALDSQSLELLLGFISTKSPIRKELELALNQALNNEKVAKLVETIGIQKRQLLAALTPTPAHIESAPTELVLSQSKIELATPHFEQLLSHSIPLDSHQFEQLIVDLSQLLFSYQQLLNLPLSELAQGEIPMKKESVSRELHEGFQVLILLYRQQQSKSFAYASAQNKFLNSIITSQKTHTAIDVIWQRSFKPAAQQSLATLKQNYLSKLVFIKHNTGKVRQYSDELSSLITSEQAFSQALTKLLWPTQGLFEFYDHSDDNLKQAAALISQN